MNALLRGLVLLSVGALPSAAASADATPDTSAADECDTAPACYQLAHARADACDADKGKVDGCLRLLMRSCELGLAAGCEEAGSRAAVAGRLTLAAALRMRALSANQTPAPRVAADRPEEPAVEQQPDADLHRERQPKAAGEASRPRNLRLLTKWELHEEYADQLRAKPGLGGPLALTIGGLGGFALAGISLGVGGGCTQQRCDSLAVAGGFAAAGILSLAIGIAWLVHRMPARQEADEQMARINAQLEHRGAVAVSTDDPDEVLPRPARATADAGGGSFAAGLAGLLGAGLAYVACGALALLLVGGMVALGVHGGGLP